VVVGGGGGIYHLRTFDFGLTAFQAISKSFGRVNNYTIQPSQELIAIGITNIFAPFFGAYPATGSFSRTAIKSKAGVRTPFAGVITAAVVLLAIYCLTAVFFYIPSSSLSAGSYITPTQPNPRPLTTSLPQLLSMLSAT